MFRRRETLETLVRIRRRQQDLRAQALTRARNDITKANETRSSLVALQRDTLERAAVAARDNLDASDVRRYYQYERYLARLIDAKDSEIHQLEAKAEARRAELERALHQRRMMEKLEDQADTGRLAEFRRQEQKALDEVATTYKEREGT